jgi:putative transposase
MGLLGTIRSSAGEQGAAVKSRTEKGAGKQVGLSLLGQLGQRLMPLVAEMAATKQGLLEWMGDFGASALKELIRSDVERLAGPKGRHRADRTHHYWGRTRTELTLGGRRISMERPRVRSKQGREARLPSIEGFRDRDPLSERVMNQILLGVSTRGYEASLEPRPREVVARGSGKSSASRALVAKTRERLGAFLQRRLDDVDLIALLVDGIEVARQTVVVALGISADGSKVPLGLAQGSTENAALCTTLLQGLVSRGLKVEDRILCIIDGGKGIRKALGDVFGDRALIQRCQVHKQRNLREHLPEERQAYVRAAMRDAYRATTADTARKKLRALASWLEGNGHEDAAASLREGLEETLTVVKLELPPTLRRSLATTNTIENLVGSIRRVTRNVKRWRGTDMIRRWTALGLFNASKRFRRIKGHREMPKLVAALRTAEAQVEVA